MPFRRPAPGPASWSPQAGSIRPRPKRIAAEGIAVITLPDNRWDRVDIKSIALLPNVLAKQAAREQGAREAWFVASDGTVTEGSSSNAWIVTRDGALVTRKADRAILRGITRTVLLDVLRAHDLTLDERPFTVAEAHGAREAFITSASQTVMPVVRIDGQPVGNGAPGLVASALRRISTALPKNHDNWSRRGRVPACKLGLRGMPPCHLISVPGPRGGQTRSIGLGFQ